MASQPVKNQLDYEHLPFDLISKESALIMEKECKTLQLSSQCNSTHSPVEVMVMEMISPSVEIVIFQKVPHLQAFIGEVVECKNQQIG